MGARHYGERTGTHGVALFDPAPPGRLRVCAFAPDQDVYDLESKPPTLVLGEIGVDGDALTLRLQP